VANVLFYESTFQAGTPYPLKLSTILDSGTTLHIFNDLSRFHNFRKAPRHQYVTAGSSEVPILGYGDVDVRVTRPNGSRGTLHLKGVAFCTDFQHKSCFFQPPSKKGILLGQQRTEQFLGPRRRLSPVCDGETLWSAVIEYVPLGSVRSAFITSRLPRRRKRRVTSRDPRPDSKGDAKLWHLRLGHPGPMSLHQLGVNALGVKLNGPKTTECQH
jgi:Pol polyprotein